jgi:hypothetical protein
MAKVDCRKLRAGDTVHFRCGGSCLVDVASDSIAYPFDGIFINFVGTNHGINVKKDGKLISRAINQTIKNCPFDIVKVT